MAGTNHHQRWCATASATLLLIRLAADQFRAHHDHQQYNRRDPDRPAGAWLAAGVVPGGAKAVPPPTNQSGQPSRQRPSGRLRLATPISTSAMRDL